MSKVITGYANPDGSGEGNWNASEGEALRLLERWLFSYDELGGNVQHKTAADTRSFLDGEALTDPALGDLPTYREAVLKAVLAIEDEAAALGRDEHVVTLSENGWRLEHPTHCRHSAGCIFTEWLASQMAPDRDLGRYVMTWPDPENDEGPQYAFLDANVEPEDERAGVMGWARSLPIGQLTLRCEHYWPVVSGCPRCGFTTLDRIDAGPNCNCPESGTSGSCPIHDRSTVDR